MTLNYPYSPGCSPVSVENSKTGMKDRDEGHLPLIGSIELFFRGQPDSILTVLLMYI